MSLRASAIIFGVLWTMGMLWWNSLLEVSDVVIWSVTGVATAFAWYWLMGIWLKVRAK